MSIFSTAPRIPATRADTDPSSFANYSSFSPAFQKKEPRLWLLSSSTAHNNAAAAPLSSTMAGASSPSSSSQSPRQRKAARKQQFLMNTSGGGALSTAVTAAATTSRIPQPPQKQKQQQQQPSMKVQVATTGVSPSASARDQRYKFKLMLTQLAAFERSSFLPDIQAARAPVGGDGDVRGFAEAPPLVHGKVDVFRPSTRTHSTRGTMALTTHGNSGGGFSSGGGSDSGGGIGVGSALIVASGDKEGPASYNVRDVFDLRLALEHGKPSAQFRPPTRDVDRMSFATRPQSGQCSVSSYAGCPEWPMTKSFHRNALSAQRYNRGGCSSSAGSSRKAAKKEDSAQKQTTR